MFEETHTTIKAKKIFGLVEITLTLIGGALALSILTDWQMPMWPSAWGEAPSVFAVLLTLTVLFGLIPFTLHWWRELDEAAQEAHKWAWWWGGNTGAGIAGIVVAFFAFSGLAWVEALSTAQLLGLGFGAALAGQTAGYAIGWLWWWQSRR